MLDCATAAGIRPQLVRPVRDRRAGRCRVWTASVRPDDRWLQVAHVDDLTALAALDVDALAAGQRAGLGDDKADPLVLVCTHGRRDVCCARLGAPVARLLDDQLRATVLETTHVGGDRFAPNRVALPWGSYHGGMPAGEAAAVAAAALAGDVVRSHFRGRAGLPRDVQSADWFLRTELGLHRLDDVCDAGRVDGEVVLEVAGVRYAVAVRERAAAQPRLTSCAAGGTVDAPSSYVFEGVRVMA